MEKSKEEHGLIHRKWLFPVSCIPWIVIWQASGDAERIPLIPC